jgi:hypothetical protein
MQPRSSTSTSTVSAPAISGAFAVAFQVSAGTYARAGRSSPSATISASVHDEVATTCSGATPSLSASAASNSAISGPCVAWPARYARFIASSAPASSDGGRK